MRKSRFTEAQIIGMIKEQEAGMPTAEVCRMQGLSKGTLYKYKSKYGGMSPRSLSRLMPTSAGHAQPRDGMFCLNLSPTMRRRSPRASEWKRHLPDSCRPTFLGIGRWMTCRCWMSYWGLGGNV